MDIQSGGLVSNGTGSVGSTAGSLGTVNVSGTNSRWANSSSLTIGSNGTGVLNITAAGAVTNTTGLIGTAAGSSGTVTVNGTSTQWTNASTLTVGNSGTGILNIQSGGAVSNTAAVLGSGAGASGTVTLTGTGSRWTNSSSITVGNAGNGNLSVLAGGQATTTSLGIAMGLNSTSAVTVDGTDSSIIMSTGGMNIGSGTGSNARLTIDNSGLVSGTGFNAGHVGTGLLEIKNQGKLLTTSTGTNYVGRNAGSTGTMTIDGAGSAWESSGSLIVASSGNGSLSVTNGGSVVIRAPSNSQLRVGDGVGTIGSITVDGTGSILDAGTNLLYFGQNGQGTLNVQNGGTVVNDGGAHIGRTVSSTGYVYIDGPGSSWTNTGMYLGSDGRGEMYITNGGRYVHENTGSLRLGSASSSTGIGLVDGTGSLFQFNDYVFVGRQGAGELTIRNGAELLGTGLSTVYLGYAGTASGTLNIGAAAASPAAAPGSVSVEKVEFGPGTGGASIVFNHTGTNYIFNPDIIGAGALQFLSGETVLTGDLSQFTGSINGAAAVVFKNDSSAAIIGNSSSFSGTTNIQDGSVLSVNGSLGGVTTVSNSGRLQGSGTLNDVTIDNGGILAPGNSIGTTSVTTVTFNPGSRYEVEVNSAGQSDRIVAAGAATLNGGFVTPVPFPDVVSGSPYTILTANGGIVGQFDGVQEDLLFLNGVLTYDANNAYLTLSGDNSAFFAAAQTENQRQVSVGVLTAGTNPAVDALFRTPSLGAALNGLDQLSGELHASVSGAFIREQQSLRSLALNDDTGTGPGIFVYDGDGRLWVKSFHIRSETGDTGNTSGMDNRTWGILAGIERMSEGGDKIGLAIGTSQSDIEQDDLGSYASSDNYHAITYGSASTGPMQFAGGASYSWHQVETKRDIAFIGFSGSSEADYGAQSGEIFVEAAAPIRRDASTITPYAQAAYTVTRNHSFTETGVGGLRGDKTINEVPSTTLGMRYAYGVPLNEAQRVDLKAGIGWRHNYGSNVDPQAKLRFADTVGLDFKVEGAPLAANEVLIDAGINLTLTPSVSVGLIYDAAYSRKSRSVV